MGRVYITKTIAAENTFSDPCKIVGHASFSLSGTWVATVYLQRTADGINYSDVTNETGTVLTWTGNVTANVFEATNSDLVLYRFGVKTGDYTSGTIVGKLTQ